MTDKNNRISSGVMATIAAAAVAVAGVTAYFTLKNSSEPISQDPPIEDSSGQKIKPKLPATNGKEATVYWLESSGTSLSFVPQGIQVQADANKPSEFLEATFNNLLAGPTEGSGSTAIPTETKLLGVKAEGDEVRVNLSDDFQSGGGSAGMIGRVGQVVYTATTLNPQAKVYLELNGEQVEVLGGEGLELDQPLTRDNFTQNFEL
ncbi:MAG: GerMN domain-containing protein [Cyanobacteria bacterium P01_A01_bin.80]